MLRRAPRILFVEDNVDLKDMIEALLVDHGYEVDTAESAVQGLEHLGGTPYDVVITDHHMPPGETGLEMLERAKDKLTDTVTFIVTANPDAIPDGTHKVLKKPVDVDEFLEHIHDALEPARQRMMASAKQQASDLPMPAGAKIDFVLYVSAASPSSVKATRHMLRLLEDYPAGQVGFRIRDLAKEPIGDGDEDRITFTPTLVKRAPAPRAWVVGDLENITYVVDLISAAGVEKK